MAEESGLNILLVEDNPTERWLFTELLRSRGHTVTACEDAESGWEEFLQDLPPLILLDWVLPGMDGLELCRKIRQHPAGERTVAMEDFFTGPRTTVLEAGDVLVSIEVPTPEPNTGTASVRQGRRQSLSLPLAITAAVVTRDGPTCRAARIRSYCLRRASVPG